MNRQNHAGNPALPVCISGAGLAGSLMATMLARRGIAVEVFERRPDPRVVGPVGGRSINLALSERGLNALRHVGLDDDIRKLCIPMHGRIMHAPDGALTRQAYGQEGQYINSVSRSELSRLLLESADAYECVHYHFNTKVLDVDLRTTTLEVRNPGTGRTKRVPARLIIGADGAWSPVRARMQKSGRFNFEQRYLDYGYKELTIPPAAGGGFRIEEGGLHIWPRRDFMMIALPNQDASFTCTLFLPHEGPVSFEALDDPAKLGGFFEEHFADSLPLLPNLSEEFFTNPTGELAWIKCEPFHHGDGVLLIGDAAHAIVPFYGQGMNAAFEDCYLLDRHIDAFTLSRQADMLATYSRTRKPDADAICDLALANFAEMRAHVANPAFLARKRLEKALQRRFPDHFVPLYSMISFSNVPYAEAVARSRRRLGL